jgi:hypothetical protein
MQGYKHLVFFSFFVYPLSLDFLCVSYFTYPLWYFLIFMLMRGILLDVPIAISALSYWFMLRLRYYAFFNLPHFSVEQVLLPYVTGLAFDRLLTGLFYAVFYHQVRLPLWFESVFICAGIVLLFYKIRFVSK